MNSEVKNKVLDEISEFLNEEKSNKISDGFNIFEVAGIASKEVNICSVLVELLDPNGFHGQNRRFLDLLFDMVLPEKETEVKKPDEWVSVHKEWSTDKAKNSRFIDIVIQDSTRFIPIEVKVFAKVHKNQCEDYLKYARNRSKDKVRLIFLTFDKGNNTGLPANDVICISWDDILKWLIKCCGAEMHNENDSVRIVLLQLISVINGAILSYKISKQNDFKIVDERLNAIANALEETNMKHKRMRYKIDTEDESITYDVDKSINLFFRVQSDKYPCVLAGLIAGAEVDGKWVFTGEERKKNHLQLESKRGDGATGWWLHKEVIVPCDRFYRLFYDEYLHNCTAKINNFYDRMCKLYGKSD